MVLLSGLTLLLAHGADPRPLDWDEALANLVKFGVTFLMIGFMSYPILAPLFSTTGKSERDESETAEPPLPADQAPEHRLDNRDVVGWVGMGLLLVISMFWWLARSSLVEVLTEEPSMKEDHAHAQMAGGQVAMWGDFHAEVSRIESGEVRIYLRDSYNRDISAQFFDAKVLPLELGANPTLEEEGEYLATEPALNGAYRFLRAPTQYQEYKIKVVTPGWTSSLRFAFDGTKGKSSLPIWCATR